MGMFDYLKINKRQLPLSDIEQGLITDETEWQTKDLDCRLDRITITQEGSLFVHHEVWSWDSKTDKRTLIEESKTFILDDIEIDFYTGIKHNGKEYWFEFNATFVKGKLQNIEKVSGYENGGFQ